MNPPPANMPVTEPTRMVSLAWLRWFLKLIVVETYTAFVAAANAVALTDSITATVTNLSLPPGTWELTGQVLYTLTGATGTVFQAGVSLTAATLPPAAGGNGLGTGAAAFLPLSVAGLTATLSQAVGPVRYTNSGLAPVTVYLVARAAFTVGTVAAYGTLNAKKLS